MPRELIVFEDPKNLFTLDNFLTFIPMSGMSLAETVNAILRATFYIGLVHLVMGGNFAHTLAMNILVVAMCYVAYRAQINEAEAMADQGNVFQAGRECRGPTTGNPLMNRVYGEPIDRPDGCDPSDPAVQARIDDILFKGQNPNLFNNRVFSRTMMPNPNRGAIIDVDKFTAFAVTGDSSADKVDPAAFDRKTYIDERHGEPMEAVKITWADGSPDSIINGDGEPAEVVAMVPGGIVKPLY